MAIDTDRLVGLVRASQALFPDFAFLAADGVLDIRKRRPAVDAIRLEQSAGQFLHLHSMGIETKPARSPEELADIAAVRVSNWYKSYGEQFDRKLFFDVEHRSGTQLHTTADDPVWAETTFRRPVDISTLRLRNVGSANAVRARGLRVLTRSNGEWSVAHDGELRTRQLQRMLRTSRQYADASSRDLNRVVPILVQVLTGWYVEARKAFDALGLDPETSKQFRDIMNQELLRPRSLEWTVHGPRRCFRFWSEPEKAAYTQLAAQIAGDLTDLSPNVCFGFGAALAAVRDGDFIPHDDDLDLIIGFDPDEASTLPAGLRRVEEFLRPRGYTVSGTFSAHRHVSKLGSKHVDVFVGLFEGDTISWYPGTRGALDRQTMFPTSDGHLFGITVPLPRNPLIYLERLYGPGWRSPDPNFKHTWDRSAYADLSKQGTRAS